VRRCRLLPEYFFALYLRTMIMSFNAKDMTQGGQIANMRFRMFGQIANIIFYVLFIIFWVLCGLMLMYRLSWQTFVNGCVYWWCTTLAPMRDIIRSQPVYTINYYGSRWNIIGTNPGR
jgi:type IV secretory pathway TraG/TraD family ATPase VirD4